MAGDTKEIPAPAEKPPSSEKLGDTGRSSMQGDVSYPPLSDYMKLQIAEINRLPPEERAEAVARLNVTKEGREAAENSGGILRDGKGVFFGDESGEIRTIRYDDEEES